MRITERFISLLAALALLASPACADSFEEEARQLLSGETVQPADLIVGYLAGEGAQINPLYCNERDLISVNQLVFESVVELDDTQKPTPLLADSWTVDGKTWTFKLRSGIQFHNGLEFCADDVVASYSYFKSAGDSNPYSGRLSLIESMTAVDTYTLAVRARYTGMITLYAMTFPVLDRTTAADALPRGTGPYWYISYNVGKSFRLERNPLWWKRQPEIESITGVHYYSTGDALEALQSGDITCFSTRSYSAAFNRRLNYVIPTDYSTTTYEMLIPNLSSSSPLSDVLVRRAVMYAIDRATLVSNAYLDMAQQSEVPITPGTWLYESQSAVFYYSPERALQLLNGAGWSDLTGDAMLNKLVNGMLTDLTIDIVTYTDSMSSVRANAAEQIAANLNAVGINTTVTSGTVSEAGSAIRKGKFDLALVGVNLSEVPNMTPLFAQNGALNYSGSHTTGMDALLEATMTVATESEMKQAYSELQLYIVDHLPIMGIGFRTGTLLSTVSLAGLSGTREYDVYNGLEFVEK